MTSHYVESEWNECGSEVATSCEKELEDHGDLDREDLGEGVEMEYMQHHSKETIMIPDKHGQQLWEKPVMRDCVAGVSCIYEKIAAALGALIKGTYAKCLSKVKDRECSSCRRTGACD